MNQSVCFFFFYKDKVVFSNLEQDYLLLIYSCVAPYHLDKTMMASGAANPTIVPTAVIHFF